VSDRTESNHRRPPASAGRWLVFWALVLLVVVLVVEGGARVALLVFFSSWSAPGIVPDAGRAGSGTADRIARREVAPYTGYTFTPMSRIGEGKRHYRGVTCETNALGFIGAEELPRRGAGRHIVVVTGGSFSVDLVCLGSQTLRNALGRSPGFENVEIVIVGLGTDGYKQPQQVLSLDLYLALGGEVDTLVNVDGFNEIRNTAVVLDEMAAAFYPIHWQFLLQSPPGPAAREVIAKTILLDAVRTRAAAAHERLSFSAFARLLFGAFERIAVSQRARLQHELQRAQIRDTVCSYRDCGPPSAEAHAFARDPARMWAQGSRLLHERARSRGARYLHVLQPNQYVPGSKPISKPEAAIAISQGSPEAGLIPEGYRRLASAGLALARDGIEFSDARDIFRDVPAPLYADNCCHVHPEGQRLVAEHIATLIARRPRPPRP
jgi:hypothetical protein